MTIKPLLSQKSGKHEKKDIQDVQAQNLPGSTVRPSHRGACLNQISQSPKSPSPQREQKAPNRSVYDVVGACSRRRRSPHTTGTRRNKRDVVREREKTTCKSPQYSVDVITPCSSPHQLQQTAGKSPKTTHGQVPGAGSPSVVVSHSNTAGNNNNLVSLLEEALSGYNSGDEHIGTKDGELTPDQWEMRDKTFKKAMSDRGFVLNQIEEDGACLFRAISLQIYGDQDMHEVIRQQTMDYIYQNREYFAQFVTEDISSYVSRKRMNHVHGNHIEIQAISEIYNRPVELYCYQTEPINIFNSDQLKNGYEPLRLSYQRGSHYNAILNPYNASVGVGLGLAGYCPDEPDVKQLREAVRLSEDLEIEQTMFEDKLKTTDWEATNEAIEEQIARESYMQWCRDNMQTAHQKPINTSSSTVTSSEISGNKSPSGSGESSIESEDFTPYPSDDERANGDFGAGSSSGLQEGHSNTMYFVQQRQRRRKRRRGAQGNGGANGSGGGSPTCATTAGPSSFSTPIGGVEFKHSASKIAKLSRRNQQLNSESSTATATASNTAYTATTTVAITEEKPSGCPSITTEMPGTSKQISANDRPMSEFYHSLLESSYADDLRGRVGEQLSEKEMVQKALQMSRLDFVQKQQQHHKTDSDPPSP